MKLITQISIRRTRTACLGSGIAALIFLSGGQVLHGRSSSPVSGNVQIDNLQPNQRLTNSLFTVTGSTRTKSGVRDVRYRLNGGTWSSASGTTAWAAPIRLLPGTNVFEAFDTDGDGTPGLPVRMSCFLAVPGNLKLQTSGWGSVSRLGFTGNRLDIGKSYRVQAVPGEDQEFAGWAGDISSTNNPLAFVMHSNMLLHAQFKPKPFIQTAGNYVGLFYPADEQGSITGAADATNSGLINLKLMSDGRFTGRIVLQGVAQPVTGRFGLEFKAQADAPQPAGDSLHIEMELDPDARVLSGTVARKNQWSSSLLARKSLAGTSNEFVGTYTLLVEGCDTGGCFVGPPVPLGDCPLAIKMTRSGTLQIAGTLADGAIVSQTVPVAEDGSWPLYAAIYGGRGLLIGWESLSESCDVSVVLWQKPPGRASDRYYTNGFSNSRVALVSPYHPPSPRQNAVAWTNGIVVLSGGDLPFMLTNRIALSGTEVRVLGGSISNLNLSIKRSDGSFSGTFRHPATHRTQSFKGTLVQSCPDYFNVASGGWFLGTNTAGAVRLHPLP